MQQHHEGMYVLLLVAVLVLGTMALLGYDLREYIQHINLTPAG